MRTTREWEEALLAADVPHAPVWNYAELFSHPHTAARGLRVTVTDPSGRPVDLIGSPFHITGTTLPKPALPPRLGQDTDAVLHDLLGLNPEQLLELRAKRII
jgi:crotonobetainyl-CoA:carnitine CoA-transferase CaiB-like acyl-CoA transferase